MRKTVTIGIMGTSGVATIGEVLFKASEKIGCFAFMQRHNTSQIREGPVAVKITIDSVRPRQCCEDTVDIFVCFSRQDLFVRDFALAENALVFAEDACREFARLAKEKTGSEQGGNIVGLGLIARYLAWPQEPLRQILEEDQLAQKNLECLDAGFGLAEHADDSFAIAKSSANIPKIVAIDGNRAIAMAALYAGCRFLGFYPITPGTDIAEWLIRKILAAGGSIIQGEDEIASLGFCIGASEGGVKSLNVTSGPGLSLETETIVLAVMDEIPLVIVDVQRAGPSTGIPTMTEQSDLWQAVKGGHGDAPRVVLAPYNIEECYRLGIEAFNISEVFQVPVIVLSDQWLGQSKAVLANRFLERQHIIRERLRLASADMEDYARYMSTPSSISPMVDVGDKVTYQTTGLTHDERGRPSANFLTHWLMHRKRQSKLDPLRQRTDLVKVFGPRSAKIGIVTWGSTARVVREVIKEMGIEKKVRLCVPELISPLPVPIIQDFLAGLEKVLFLEMNDSGQFYRYLKTEIDLPRNQAFYFRPGGLPFLQEEVADWLKEELLNE